MSDSSNNILPITPSQLETHLRIHGKTGLSMFVWGSPGVSKSASVKAYANALGVALIDLRVGQLDAGDIRGLPYPVNGGEDGIRWAAPQALPRNLNFDKIVTSKGVDVAVDYYNPLGDNGIRYCTDPKIAVRPLDSAHEAIVISREEYLLSSGLTDIEDINFNLSESPMNDQLYVRLVRKGDETKTPVEGKFRVRIVGETKAVLALEEMNSGNISVQGASYQLILDRRCGEYIVPKNVQIIALGNRETDKGTAGRQPLPLSNRFVHYEVVSNLNDWIEWAFSAGVHSHVIGYLTKREDDLDRFDSAKSTRGFATPRTWEMVSRILNENPDVPFDVLSHDITGAVGVEVGNRFIEFRKTFEFLPDVEDVLSGKLKKSEGFDFTLSVAMTANLIYAFTKEYNKLNLDARVNTSTLNTPEFVEYLRRLDNGVGYMNETFTYEMMIAAVRRFTRYAKIQYDARRMPNYSKVAMEYIEITSHNAS